MMYKAEKAEKQEQMFNVWMVKKNPHFFVLPLKPVKDRPEQTSYTRLSLPL